MPGLSNSEGWASGPTDFDDEYGYFCEVMNGGIERMDEETTAINSHRESLKHIQIRKLLEEDDDIERIKADVLQARKTVFAVEKFLNEDVNNSLRALRDALSGYIKVLAEKITLKKIKGKYVIVDTISGKNLVIAAQLVAELKELEKMLAQLEDNVSKMAAHEEIEGFNIEQLVDDASTKHQKEREEEERKAKKDKKKEEEERRRQKEEERRKKEEEERLRREEEKRKKEEEDRLCREEEEVRRKAEEEERRQIEEEERKRREEEERLRREEEEQRRKAEEEERRRREEEERRKREEEEARRREDERLWKADPRDWPALIYDLPHGQDPVGSGVACVIRGPDDYVTLHKDQFVCEYVTFQQNRYRPQDNEEVVSAMIRLRPADGMKMTFKTRIWIAIAYAGVTKNRETVIRFQTIHGPKVSVVEKEEQGQEPEPEPQAEAEADVEPKEQPESDPVLNTEGEHGEEAENGEPGKENQHVDVPPVDNVLPPAVARVSVLAPAHPITPVATEQALPAEWIDVLMRETNVTGYETFRFVETPITELDANGINIIVVTRPKTDSDTWNNKGGRLVSSVDPRVSIAAPKNSFRLTTDIRLQVIALDSSALNGLKERYDTCDQLIGSSPMLVISMSNKPTKPLTISVANPSGGGKKPKVNASGKSLPQSGKTQGRGNGSPQVPDDVLSVLVKDIGGKWRHRDSVDLDQQRDCIVFQLEGAPQCIIILRTQPGVDSAELCRIAADLENSIQDRPSQLVVRQHTDNPNLVFIECCRRDTVDKLINGRLQTAQFTDGPDPSRLFVLREGDLVEITFRDNIHAVDGFDEPRQFIFNSNMPTIDLQLNVSEVERYAQNALDVYRGFVRLSLVDRAYQPPPRLAVTGAGGSVTGNRKPPPGVAKNAAADKNMVAEVMLNLPKPNKGRNTINRMNIGINGPPPLCVEYFDKLAADLGDDWLRLSIELKVTAAATQRIVRENEVPDDPVLCAQRAARAMLGQWYRSQSKSNRKVEDLKEALVGAGRNDLAEVLYTQYKEARMEQDRKLEEIHLQKSINEFLDDSSAAKAWREFGRDLGLSVEQLEEIGGPAPRITARKVVVDAAQARGLAQRMLEKWKESAGEKATSESLLGAVQKYRLTELAAKMSAIREAP